MQTNKYIITNKRTGEKQEVSEKAYNNLKRGVNRNSFTFSIEAQDIGEAAPIAKTKKKTSKKED
jgi:hypothetical protein